MPDPPAGQIFYHTLDGEPPSGGLPPAFNHYTPPVAPKAPVRKPVLNPAAYPIPVPQRVPVPVRALTPVPVPVPVPVPLPVPTVIPWFGQFKSTPAPAPAPAPPAPAPVYAASWLYGIPAPAPASAPAPTPAPAPEIIFRPVSPPAPPRKVPSGPTAPQLITSSSPATYPSIIIHHVLPLAAGKPPIFAAEHDPKTEFEFRGIQLHPDASVNDLRLAVGATPGQRCVDVKEIGDGKWRSRWEFGAGDGRMLKSVSEGLYKEAGWEGRKPLWVVVV